MSVILRVGSNNEEVLLLQKALNELCGVNLSADGVFGNGTKNAMMAYQRERGYNIDGIFEDEAYPEITELIERKYIRFSELDEYALNIGVEPAMLKAFASVESKGSGFFNNGLCTILFERHIFYNQVVRKFGQRRADEWSQKFPNICYPKGAQTAYFGGVREWTRFDQAKDLDAECALMSASYGMFQIMGFNYGVCGYENVGDFVTDMCESERWQIGAVTMFIKNNRGLFLAVRNKDFNEVARLYNGSNYAYYGYHTKLAKAYDNFSKQ